MVWLTKEQIIELYKERDEALFFDYKPIRAKKIKPPKQPKSQENQNDNKKGGKVRYDISNFARRLNQNPAKEPRKSCARFEKTKQGAREHNFREYKPEHEPDYLLPREFRKEPEFWEWELKNDKGEKLTPKEFFNAELAKYGKSKGKRPRYENSLWECVLVLNETHTKAEVAIVKDYIEKKLNITCYEFAIHRDEGHLDENKRPVYNYHAHLNFVTIKDKQQNFRLTKTKRIMPQVQTEIAKLLNMPRGEFKSPRNHLRPQEYRQLMKLKRLVFKLLQKRKNLRAERSADKAEIQRLTNAIKEANEKIAQIETLTNDLKKANAENSRLKTENENLQAQLTTANAQITALKENSKKAAEAQQEKPAEPKQQAADKIPSQNDKSGSNFAENQKNDVLSVQEQKIDLKAEFNFLQEKALMPLTRMLSNLSKSDNPENQLKRLNEIKREMQELEIKSPTTYKKALNTFFKGLKSTFDEFMNSLKAKFTQELKRKNQGYSR